MILDDYENEILEAYESGKLVPSHPETDFQIIAKNCKEGQPVKEFHIKH